MGGTFVYFVGTSQSEPDGAGGTVSASEHLWTLGVEGGYELPAGPVIVRPYIGLGIAEATGSVSEGGQSISNSQSNFAFTIGGTGLYPITPNIGVGVDLRFILVSNSNAFVPSLTGQYHF